MSASQQYDDSLVKLQAEFEKVKVGLDKVAGTVGNLSKEVSRTTDSHDRLSAEHSALTGRVNHIDLRMSVMEETSRLQQKHNDDIHAMFREGLQKMEKSVDKLEQKMDEHGRTMLSSNEKLHTELHRHIEIEEVWQKRFLLGLAITATTALVGVLGYFGKWIFLNVVGG